MNSVVEGRLHAEAKTYDLALRKVKVSAADLVLLDPASNVSDLQTKFSARARFLVMDEDRGTGVAIAALVRRCLPEAPTIENPTVALPECRWFRLGRKDARRVALATSSREIFELIETSGERVCAVAKHEETPLRLYCLAAPDAETLVVKAGELKRRIMAGDAPPTEVNGLGPFRLALVHRDPAATAERIDRAVAKIGRAPSSAINNPAGLFYDDSRRWQEGRTAFLFAGQGSQYDGMYREHILRLPAFTRWFDGLDRHAGDGGILACGFLHAGDDPAMLAPQEAEALGALEGGGIATIAGEVAGYEALAALGLNPDVLCGYSNGENAAFVAAGMLGAADPDTIFPMIAEVARAGRRGSADGDIPLGDGLAVSMVNAAPLREALARLDGVWLATDNTPGAFTLFGNPDAIDRADALCRDAGAITLRSRGIRSYHTPAFGPEMPSVATVLQRAGLRAPSRPVLSAASVDYYPAQPSAITDLAGSQYMQTVRFREAIERLYADGIRCFVDLGPGGQLAGYVAQTLATRPHRAIAVDRFARAGLSQFMQAVGQLHCLGLDLDNDALPLALGIR